MATINPVKFIQQVRAEVSKVVWPTRREVLLTTVMVFILVFLSSVFFFVADQILNWVVSFFLGLAG